MYSHIVCMLQCMGNIQHLTIHRAGNGPFIVHVGKEDEFFVDKVRVGDVLHPFCVEERLIVALIPLLPAMLQPLSEPLLTTLNTLLTERLE